jgi:hypothetical protein
MRPINAQWAAWLQKLPVILARDETLCALVTSCDRGLEAVPDGKKNAGEEDRRKPRECFARAFYERDSMPDFRPRSRPAP